MTRLEITRHVDAEPAACFAVASDLRNSADTIGSIVSCEVLTDGPIRVGTRVRETRRMFGREATEEMEVTRFDEGRGFTLECTSHGCHYKSDIDCLPEDGGTILRMTFVAQPRSLVAKIMGFLMKSMFKKMAVECGRDLDDVKRKVEAGIDGPARDSGNAPAVAGRREGT